MITIRPVEIADIPRLLEIYDYYVKNTAISFEYQTPTALEFKKRIEKFTEHYPYLVAMIDGEIVGYAYASAMSERDAYMYSCELSIYVDKVATKCGVGRRLYEELESRLKDMGITNLYACIASPIIEDEYLTNNSPEFHEHMGFKKVGELHGCGYKFKRWYNIIWMEKIIGEK